MLIGVFSGVLVILGSLQYATGADWHFAVAVAAVLQLANIANKE